MDLTAQLALVTAAFELQTLTFNQQRQQTSLPQSMPRSQQQNEQHTKVLSLKQVVSLMYKEDPSCVLIVRRIQRLGFRSVPVLREFFQAHLGCNVRRITVVHSRSKGATDPSKGAVRPANMAFILMDNSEDVQRALAAGPNVAISIADQVSLHPFVKHTSSGESTGDSENFHEFFVLPSGML